MTGIHNVSNNQGFQSVQGLSDVTSSLKQLKKKNEATETVKIQAEEPAPTEDELKAQLQAKLEKFAKFLENEPQVSRNVIFSILALLQQLNETTNITAITKADILRVQTDVQAVYVQLLEQIPIITIATVNDEGRRMQMNQQFNLRMESCRARKSLVENDAKMTQAQLNSTKEFGTSLSDIFASLIQQIKGLTSRIFGGG